MLDLSSWPIFTVVVLFISGLVLIIKGGDYFVDAASWIAKISGIPKFIIGATIVSVATTLPELIVSCLAAAMGSIDMAVGNAVGSVTANTGLIMAISLTFMPSNVKRQQYAFKSLLLIIATTILWIFSIAFGDHRSLSYFGSIILLFIFIIFIYENVRSAKSDAISSENSNQTKTDIIKYILLFIVGAAGIVFGAEFLVDGATEFAHRLNISETIISVTIVAVGTSLPELTTTITAMAKKQSSLSVGNIIGANIIDIAIILPICSMISGKPLPISAQGVFIDMPICLLCVCIGIIPMLISSKFRRWQGIALILIYIGYLLVITCAPQLIPH